MWETMKKLEALFKKTNKQDVNLPTETGKTISAGKSKEDVKYEMCDPKIDKISLSLCSATKREVEDTCNCAISNSQPVISFRSPSNRNIKNVVGHSMLRIGRVSSMSPRMFEESQDFLNLQMNAKRFNKQSNTCILNINNSRRFHIGPRKIINVRSCTKRSLQKSSFIQMTPDQQAEKFNNTLEILLESYEMLTKEVIEIIAVGLEKKWKEFGRKLGFTECFFYEIELQNERNMPLIAYDMLKQYIYRFPNTTFGFIISILIEMSQKSIIDEIILQQQSEINFFVK